MSVSKAQELTAALEEFDLWSPYEEAPANGFNAQFAAKPIADQQIELTQMLTPQRNTAPLTARRPSRGASSRRNSNLASVPFMIGDTGSGSCVSFGNILDVELAHPTLACSRLNISEANTPVPIDRLYYSFRHFHNATPVRVYQFSQDFDLNRHTLGGERTFFDKMMSMEIRVPIDDRLTSTAGTYIVNNDSLSFPPGFDIISGAGGQETRVELGNISMIFKALLLERRNFALSAGLGVTLPTSRDVTFDAIYDDFVTFDQFPFLARYNIQISAIASNETVYLSPYLAWLWQKDEKFFHQGFLQVETAANDSFFTAGGLGLTSFDNNLNGTVNAIFPEAGDEFNNFVDPLPLGVAKIQPQTLLRLNLGWGYTLKDDSRADWLRKLTALFEVHYTTTLSDANINTIPFFISGSNFTGFGQDGISVGNRNNRIDILNVVTGLSANIRNWVVTNGVTAPIRTGSDRGFDFEYNLQVQRPF